MNSDIKKAEIQHLTEYFIQQTGYDPGTCNMFAKVAVEGGYKFKKCFNEDHK